MKRLLCRLGVWLGLLEPRPSAPEDLPQTIVIPAGTTWRGSLVCAHDVVVDGVVAGSIICPGHRVTINPSGAVRSGAIRAAVVCWRGEVSAAHIACKSLRVEPTARNERGLEATSAAYEHLRIARGVKVDIALRHAPYDLDAETPTTQETQSAFVHEPTARAA